MKLVETTGNIWDYQGKAIIAITTNGSVSRSGRANIGRGVAAQAAGLFQTLPEILGASIIKGGNHVHYLENNIVSFPVEHSPYEIPDLKLIKRSAEELAQKADELGWSLIVVPRPGCGGGGLLWKEVKPILEAYFDQRFIVISVEK
jgi:hypothetical protein